jgi:C4-dicarboxylate-specific signal transduction histidine kinase
VTEAVERGAPASEVLPLVEDYAAGVAETVDNIERRLIQYSGLASLGTIAGMLTHEVRNHSVPIGRLCHQLRELIKAKNSTALRLEKSIKLTEASVSALQRLADTFAPLSNAAFRTKRRNSVLEDVIRTCIEIRKQRIRIRKVVVQIVPPDCSTQVAMDPGELSTIVLNLLDNALYWLSFVSPERERRIRFKIGPTSMSTRVSVQLDDNGPGVAQGDEERIFWPGVTRKKEGLGMGLTVVSEIVTQHKGRIGLITPGYLGGASFRFDLPLVKPHA